MISPLVAAEIRRLFFAEHWKVGTLAERFGLHHSTVERIVRIDRFAVRGRAVPSRLDPYIPFIVETLKQHPRLTATRIHEMVVDRGYPGSVVQTRRLVKRLRPAPQKEAFFRLHVLPGEEGQVDWASFGKVRVGQAERPLSAFVMVLSHSRALHACFTLDQTLETFLDAHVQAFRFFGGVPRRLLYDNLKTAVLERALDVVHFQPRFLDFCGHYRVQPLPVGVRRGNEKGRIERQIRFLRERFFAARTFRDVADLNAQFVGWRERWAHARPWPGGDDRTVRAVFEAERPLLLPLPEHPFDTCRTVPVVAGKTPYVRFDRNDYSIPPEQVGKALLVVASQDEVRVLDGQDEVARHPRCYDRHQVVEDPRHADALAAHKRRAKEARGKGLLLAAVPRMEELFTGLLARGYGLGNPTQQLVRLLDEYGKDALTLAVHEALDRGTPHPASVAHLLERERRRRNQPPPVPVSLPDRPEVRAVRVTPHLLESYDALAQPDDAE